LALEDLAEPFFFVLSFALLRVLPFGA